MSELEKPFPAYTGDDSYVFVCYAHRDAPTVYEDMAALHAADLNLWYDEGIGAGKSWRGEIADAIKGASKLLFFVSNASLESAHCVREVGFALDHDIDIVPVYLEDAKMPGELELALNRVQAIFRQSDARYSERLIDALRGRSAMAGFSRRNRKRSASMMTAVGLLVVAGIAWMWSQSGPTSTEVSGEPSAFDYYLEGLDLFERWDKGDNLEQSIELFRSAAEADREFALAYARLADSLRVQYALTGDEQLLNEAKTYAEEAARLDDSLAPVHVALASVHARLGNNDLAFAAVERALQIDANDAVANQTMANMLTRRGRPEEAETYYKKAVALDPEHIGVASSYANFLYNQSRLREAAQLWQAALRLAPDHYPTLVNLGSVLTELNQIPESIAMYQRALEIEPTYMAWSNLGTAYSRGERYDDAEAAFREALAIDDSDWLAWGNLAWVLRLTDPESEASNEAYGRAIEIAEAAREQNPRDPWIFSDLGLYYAKTGQTELASQRLDTALALASDSGEILAAGAETWEVIGDRDKAVELALRALNAGFTRQQLARNAELAELLEDPRMAISP